MATEKQEKQWVIQIQQGGQRRRSAIVEIYDDMALPLTHFFASKTSNTSHADDMVQDVFIKVITKIDSYKGDARFSSWVWAIARNDLKMHYRSNTKSFTELDEIENDLHCVEENEPTNDIKDCVHKGLLNFEVKHKERAYVLRLIAQHEWEIKDVAGFLDRTIGATREYLSQCRKKVKPFIANCFELIKG